MAEIDWNLWEEGEDGADYCESVYQLAKHFNPKNGLEIGVRFGKSALASLWGAQEMRLIGVDPNPEFEVVEFMSKYTDRFAFINEPSPEALEKFEGKETFDWIYIDGRHDFMGVLYDFKASWPLLKKGGVMIFDDYKADVDYGTDVAEVLKQYTKEITGKEFKHITSEDLGLHPSPHEAAVLVK